jgi:adenylate cyclase
MSDLGPKTIDQARSDIAELRRGLEELAAVLTSHDLRTLSEEDLSRQLAQFGRVLDDLDSTFEEQEKKRLQLDGLLQVSRTLNSTLDLNEVLNRAIDIIIEVTRAERGFLMLADPATGELAFQVARNMDRATIASPAFQVSCSIIERVAQTGAPVITTDALTDPRFSFQESVVSLSLRSILCHPLKTRERVIGVIYVDNRLRAGQFQSSDLEALRAFADQAAIAIENARLFESVRQKRDEINALKTFQDNIFASIASGVIATDLSDRITAFNRAAETIFAIPAEQLLGRRYAECLMPLASARLPQLIDKAKHTSRGHVRTEIESILPARGTVNLSLNVSSLQDAAGEPQGVTIVVEDLTEKRQLEATREMFRRYVAPAVVDRLPSNPDQLRLGGHRQEITILFADLRGFTHLSESLAPEELVVVLNEYLAAAAGAILEYEGTLDKFMGDAVMAIFNAPLAQRDHALRAARAALRLRQAIAELHTRLPQSLHLSCGVGIHTGDAVVGNVGTQQQMNFTAIGDAVNLAKRLQEDAAGGQVLLSAQTYTRICDAVKATMLPPRRVKGRRQLEQVWQLESIGD